MKLVQAWVELHKDELLAEWTLAASVQQPYNIEPLLEDYTLHLEFSNGEHGVYDCKPLLNFGVFKELQNLQYFQCAACDHGTVV